MITAHPVLPEFDYIKPSGLKEASQFLAEHAGEARVFMGATDTIVRMRDGFWKDKYLVDVKQLEGMNVIRFDPASGLEIGAAASMNKVIASPEVQQYYPLLAQAGESVASYQLRSRATIAGNICNASPAGDTIGSCLAYGGSLRVHGVDGFRVEPLATFFKAPGKTALKPGDIVTAVLLPLPPKDHVGKYLKLGRNKVGDLAIVGVTVLAYPDASVASGYRFRIALASVAATPVMPEKAAAILAEKAISEATIDEAADAAMDSVKPIDDVRGTARYRKLMVRNLTRRGIAMVWAGLKK